MADGSWERLLEIMARLRGPGGCPWDREQTSATLKKYVIEEAHEVAEAIDRGNPDELADELGDLLLQVVFQAQVAAEAGLFTIEDVASRIVAKLVRRHPHIFGEANAASPGEVLRNWEEIKKAERGERASLFDGIPASLAALRRAARVQSRASTVGFDWTDPSGPLDKLTEEVAEVAADWGDEGRVFHELGDVLFAAVNVARHAGVEAEDALNAAVDRFRRRFAHVERELERSGRNPSQATLEEMDELWNDAKRLERGEPSSG